MNSSSTLVVIGSGPGIGSTTASLFAKRQFNKIALVSRDKGRLEKDRTTVLKEAKDSSREVDVQTWSTDIANTNCFRETLNEIQGLGKISCVLFNAARVEPTELLKCDEKEIMQDFMVGLFALLLFRVMLTRTDYQHWSLYHSNMGTASPPSRNRQALALRHKQSVMG